jgi:hypothetical protein
MQEGMNGRTDAPPKCRAAQTRASDRDRSGAAGPGREGQSVGTPRQHDDPCGVAAWACGCLNWYDLRWDQVDFVRACALRRLRPPATIDCDHLLRSIATSEGAVGATFGDSQYSGLASREVEAVPVVNRRDPRALRSAPQLTQRRAREVAC